MKPNNPRKQITELEQIFSYLLQNNGGELIDRIHTYSVGLFVKYFGIKPKNVFKKNKNAGIQRNDLAGHFRVRGKKIYVRYKGKDIATGCDNTTTGWKLANKFWEQKINEIDAIIQGEKKAEDTIETWALHLSN